MGAPRVKIDGLRDSAHAALAARSGADFLGFVFVEGVRRQLQPTEGRAIVAALRKELSNWDGHVPQLAGLFRNQPLQWVRGVMENVGLDVAQLTGEEDLDYAAALGVPIIKQVRVKPGDTGDDVLAGVRPWLDAGHRVVLDRYDPSTPGGAGKVFDWSAAEGVADLEGVLLAGGLDPENVGDAVTQLQPWGVDVSSGVETDGAKDADKIAAFIAAAQSPLPTAGEG
jgi:phosphoribosylanthranilate isomerase